MANHPSVWWQKKGYCSDMPNVASAIDGTSHEIQIPSNEPQQQFYSDHRKLHCIQKRYIIVNTSKGHTFKYEMGLWCLPCSQNYAILGDEYLASE